MATDLHQLLVAKQDELIAKLAGSRAVIDHAGEKGEATELDWRPAMQSFLPERYQVSKASVIDADGRSSDVIDAVIHDRHYCPSFSSMAVVVLSPPRAFTPYSRSSRH